MKAFYRSHYTDEKIGIIVKIEKKICNKNSKNKGKLFYFLTCINKDLYGNYNLFKVKYMEKYLENNDFSKELEENFNLKEKCYFWQKKYCFHIAKKIDYIVKIERLQY